MHRLNLGRLVPEGQPGEYLRVNEDGRTYGWAKLPSATTDKQGIVRVGSGLSVSADALLAVALQNGGGLTFDPNGEMYVDFSTMPTDKFEELLRSIWVPVRLSSNTTWYVRDSGDDDNDGSSEAEAFRTIQKAVNYISSNFSLGTFTATIDVGVGEFEEDVTLPRYTASTGTISIRGAGAGSTIVRGCFGTLAAAGSYTIREMTIQWRGERSFDRTGYYGVTVTTGVEVSLNAIHIDLGTADADHTRNGVQAANGGKVTLTGQSRLYGNAYRFIWLDGGALTVNSDTHIDGTASAQTFYATNLSAYRYNTSANGGQVPKFLGNVTGKRYDVRLNSVVATGNGSEDFFPGTIAGTTATGGQYS